MTDIAEIMKIETRRRDDGTLRRVTVRANCYTDDPDTTEKAEVVFEVSDGVAEATDLYDANIGGLSTADYCYGITPRLFRTAAAAETAVARVPDVETVTPIEKTVAEELRAGAEADLE